MIWGPGTPFAPKFWCVHQQNGRQRDPHSSLALQTKSDRASVWHLAMAGGLLQDWASVLPVPRILCPLSAFESQNVSPGPTSTAACMGTCVCTRASIALMDTSAITHPSSLSSVPLLASASPSLPRGLLSSFPGSTSSKGQLRSARAPSATACSLLPCPLCLPWDLI